MDDDKHDDANSRSGSSRKRTPPTIDLTASSVSDSAAPGDGGASAAPSSDHKPGKSWRDKVAAARSAVTPSFRWPSFSTIKTPKPARAALSSMFVAGLTGVVAALFVLGAYWFWDSSGGSGRIMSRLPSTTAKSDRDSSGKQVAKVDSRAATATAALPQSAALGARIDALDKSVASLRDDLAAARTSVEELKTASTSRAPDTSAIEDRIGQATAPPDDVDADVRVARVIATSWLGRSAERLLATAIRAGQTSLAVRCLGDAAEWMKRQRPAERLRILSVGLAIGAVSALALRPLATERRLTWIVPVFAAAVALIVMGLSDRVAAAWNHKR